jgi:hypothetical protein
VTLNELTVELDPFLKHLNWRNTDIDGDFAERPLRIVPVMRACGWPGLFEVHDEVCFEWSHPIEARPEQVFVASPERIRD